MKCKMLSNVLTAQSDENESDNKNNIEMDVQI